MPVQLLSYNVWYICFLKILHFRDSNPCVFSVKDMTLNVKSTLCWRTEVKHAIDWAMEGSWRGAMEGRWLPWWCISGCSVKHKSVQYGLRMSFYNTERQPTAQISSVHTVSSLLIFPYRVVSMPPSCLTVFRPIGPTEETSNVRQQKKPCASQAGPMQTTVWKN